MHATYLYSHGFIEHSRNVVNFPVPDVKAGIINRELIICYSGMANIPRLNPRHSELLH